ncbi:MAG: helix-turn-helix domain-containing protein [Candidatus Limivicinus sp.]|jgi:AraC-like DNA-binding protein
MNTENTFSQEGYLEENYHYFHLRDTAGQERDFHFHSFDKIVLLISGRVDYAVEDTVYPLKPWNLLLIKHHTIHKAIIDKTEPYERIIIYLDRKFFDRALPDARLMECFDKSDKSGQHLLVTDDSSRRELEASLKAFEAGSGDEGFGAQAMRDTLMMQLLIHINRIAAAAPAAPRQRYDPKIERALSYINENLSRNLSVEALADEVFLSKYHFMRLFKAQTGSTVHAYIRQKRLMYAARLIREGTSANKAAADSGFADYSTFHRAFRESFGISPGQLKS